MANSEKILKVKKLANQFHFQYLYEPTEPRPITVPGLYRAGLELAGQRIFDKLECLIIWSSIENNFLASLNAKTQEILLKKIIAAEPPAILLTKNFKLTDLIVKMAKGSRVSVLKTNERSFDTHLKISNFIDEHLVEWETVHGSLVNIYGRGVLITGPSGIGKSEITLELIKKNHIFIADDAVDVSYYSGILHGKPSRVAKNFIEIRGLGILNVPKMFGIEKVNDECDIDIIIELKPIEKIADSEMDRIGRDMKFTKLRGIQVPYYLIPVSSGRNISDLIESAVIDNKLKRNGYNSSEEYIKHYESILKEE